MMRSIFLCLLSAVAFAESARADIALQPLTFQSIPQWSEASYDKALEAFQHSCARPPQKAQGPLAAAIDPSAWIQACSKAIESFDDPQAFFEAHFTPYRMVRPDGQEGRVTGYYLPLLKGSLKRGGPYQWPLYRVPDDFKTPYLTRAEIEAGALEGNGLEIVWLEDPVMRFFLHIQGSGRIQLPDGSIKTAQFAAKNQQPYTAIGKVLLEEGVLDSNQVSLQTIRDYLRANPQRQREIMNKNESYVFFELKDSDTMPVGGQGVPLTPMHSLAIDTDIMPYGVPVYLFVLGDDTRQLFITQDTGSAIKGPLRGDIFFGLGDEAEAKAGKLNAPALWYVLLPTTHTDKQ